MSSPAVDVATILQDHGFGFIGVNIFTTDDQASLPNNIIIVKDTGTSWPDGTRQDIEFPSLQIIGRDSKGQAVACEKKVRDIKNMLMHTVCCYTVNGAYYAYIDQSFGPNDLGLDEVMRPSYTLNITCFRQYEYS